MALDKRSPALHFQVALLEEETAARDSRPTHRKTELATNILNSILPHTGVYKDILEQVLETLRGAIYSSTRTSHSKSEPKDEFVPFFELVFRLEEEKHAAAEALRDEQEQLRYEMSKRINESESIAAALDERKERIEALEKELTNAKDVIQSKDATIEELENTIKEKVTEIEKLTATIANNNAKHERETELKRQEMNMLTEFESSYRDMQELFYKFDVSKKDPNEKKSESEIIQEQLVSIINLLLDEQEAFFDKYNSEVLKDDSDQGAEYISYWHKKYILIRESFLTSCKTVFNELKLLTSHISHESRKKAEEDEEGIEEDGKNANNDICISNLFADGKDPFNSSERITAKYSASIEVSTNDCYTFTLLPGSQICAACKATVFICPHVFPLPRSLIKLPPHTTHLQITRPLMMPEPLECLNMVQIEIEKTECEETKAFKRRLSRMWRMCREQKYHIPRNLSKAFINNLIEQFYLYVSNDEEECYYKSYLEHFIDFILGLYQMDELVELVLIDVLTAINKYANESHFIALFGMCLAQTVDPIVFQYIYLVNDILLNTDIVCTFDLRPLLLELYPFLSDEDIDPHMLTYSSQSNNRVSSYRVSQYIMQLIVKEKEPRMVECLTKLKQNSVSHPELMSFKEFCTVMETVYPLATPKILESLFMNSLVNSRKDETENKVPTKFLSQITAFLQLQGIFPAIIAEINERVVRARTKLPAEIITEGKRQQDAAKAHKVHIPSYREARANLTKIRRAARSLELLHGSTCWRDTIDISKEYLNLTSSKNIAIS